MTARLRTAALAALTALACLAGQACGGHMPPPANPEANAAEAREKLLSALREEATGDPAKARTTYLELMDDMWGSSPWELVATAASLDALVNRSVSGLSEVSLDSAIAYRTKDSALYKGDDREPIVEQLTEIQKHAHGNFSRGLITRTLEELAEHHGDWAGAARWRAMRGCVHTAAIFGPTHWAPVTGVHEPGALDAWDAPMVSDYLRAGAFPERGKPILYSDAGCEIDLGAPSAGTGVREIVVDAEVTRHQTIGVALRAHGAAVVRVGGMEVLRRPYELGGDEAVRFVKVAVDRGTFRVVVRAGADEEGQGIEIGLFSDEGDPLRTHVPKPGERATARAHHFEVVGYPRGRTPEERTAIALGALALGDGHTAEHLLEQDAKSPKAKPELLLAYARAVETAQDLSPVHRAERARGAYERVLEAWPGSWEAVLAHAVLAGVRKSPGEARLEALKDLEEHRAKVGRYGSPLLDVFEAATAGHEHLVDRARAALDRAAAPLAGTSLLYDARATSLDRAPPDAVRLLCNAPAPGNRGSLACYFALRQAGDTTRAAGELARLRTLLGGQRLFATTAFRDALASGDLGGARAAYDAMFPGERTLAAVYAVSARRGPNTSHDGPAEPGLHPDVLGELYGRALTARDAPQSFGPLLRAAGDDPTAAFAGEAERLTAADRAHPLLPNAATAVLAHTERYDVDPRGFIRYVMFDVRRVSGTTDVEQNAQAEPPSLSGRSSFRVLRRRIFKKDGRVLEPERTPNAAQSHADLSQLEQGDAVEALYEGWAVPGETGDVGIETPDLLPERTGVANADLEIRLPKTMHPAVWSHALLGKAKESVEGDRRVLRWSIHDRGTRRVEESTPKMDRQVAVSLSTMTWAEVGRALRETLLTLEDHDPAIAAWAHDAVAKLGRDPKPTEALVAAVVQAAGETVREASPSLLSDIGVGAAHGAQSMTARTILTEHEGSRSWLIVRALRELGVGADVAIAENNPYSADPAFPPLFGRFSHPLVVAHVPDPKAPPAKKKDRKMLDIWIDADVSGPPLPAGRISPELRGRSMLLSDGRVTSVPNVGGGKESERDEIDVRLVLDENGDAKGSFTVLLRGREAQGLAEALTRIVGLERQRALQGVVLGWVPYANVEEVSLSSSEGSWQVALRAKISVSGYAQVEGGTKGVGGKLTPRTWVLPGLDPIHIVFPRSGVSTLGSSYAGQGARETALAINRAIQYHAHRRVELPAGAGVARMPGPFRVDGPSLAAQRTLAVERGAAASAGAPVPSVLEDDFVLDLSTGTVAPDRYKAFVDDAHKTDDAFLASTRISPPEAPAAAAPAKP